MLSHINPFASYNPTNPRTNLWNFREKILRIDHFEKRPFWKIGNFDFFFSSKKIFFCFIIMKISPNLYGRMNGSKFWRFPCFPRNFLLCVIHITFNTVYVLKAKSYVRKTKFYVLFRTSLKRNNGHSLCSIYCHNSETLDHCEKPSNVGCQCQKSSSGSHFSRFLTIHRLS